MVVGKKVEMQMTFLWRESNTLNVVRAIFLLRRTLRFGDLVVLPE